MKIYYVVYPRTRSEEWGALDGINDIRCYIVDSNILELKLLCEIESTIGCISENEINYWLEENEPSMYEESELVEL